MPSMPLIPGRPMPISITSGTREVVSLGKASSTERKLPRHSKPSVPLMRADRYSRNSRWSSTIATLTVAGLLVEAAAVETFTSDIRNPADGYTRRYGAAYDRTAGPVTVNSHSSSYFIYGDLPAPVILLSYPGLVWK